MKRGQDEPDVAIFMAVSTRRLCETIFPGVPRSGNACSSGPQGKFAMKKVRSLLAAAPSRIGRRIAQFVAIAAASLPSAGA